MPLSAPGLRPAPWSGAAASGEQGAVPSHEDTGVGAASRLGDLAVRVPAGSGHPVRSSLPSRPCRSGGLLSILRFHEAPATRPNGPSPRAIGPEVPVRTGTGEDMVHT
ncbi:hypothetical protein SY2F82_55280 [Streptomyces sp. Y2F8-2]|nr:hypothetical protein SY2F82_55280 [Streptomyces sp. Y2F8-2]